MANEGQVCASPALSGIIESHLAELVDLWKDNIRRMNPGAAEGIGRRVSQEIEAGQDLLSLLGRFPTTPDHISDQQVAPLIEKVLGPDCTVADFYTEIDALETAFNSVLRRRAEFAPSDIVEVLANIHLVLSRIFTKVMDRSATVYEHAVEFGPQALCKVDPDGRIVYANAAMTDLLQTVALSGKRLTDFFANGDRAFVAKAIGNAGAESVVREAQVEYPAGTSKRVWLTVRPLILEGKLRGAYATAMDASYIVDREERFLDRLELPAFKLNQDFVITYSNPATYTLVGTDTDLRERSIFEIFPRSQTVCDQFKERRQGKGDIYDTEIIRPADGKHIPVRVAGTPILDVHGNYLGTLGIVRSLEREQAAEAIHHLIGVERDETALLTKLAQQLQTLVPFDGFTVNEYSLSSDHVSLWFSYSSGEQIETSRRWWPIPADQREEVKNPRVLPDLDVFLQKYQPELLNDPSVRKFLDQGFHSMLRIPIRQEDRTVASLLLMSKQINRYSDADLDLLLFLPVEQAVQMAFYYKDRRNYQFRYELFKAMARCRTAAELAELLAQRLADHYEWDHVIVAKVCKDEKVFRILAETSAVGTSNFSVDQFKQPLAAGILGHVYQTGTAVNIPCISEHDLREKFVYLWPGTQSALCLPILWDDEVQWMLNVEDERCDAFSKDQEQDVAAILSEVELILSRISRQYLLESTLESTSDAVLMTDTQQNILLANPAAARLLGYGAPSELVGPFERIFQDSTTAKRIFASTNSAAVEVDLVRKDKSTLPVLMSGSCLPEDLFRKIFICKDLTAARRLEKLESLRSLFQEVALQTHTPLALVETWIRRRAKEDARDDLYAKILAQLKRIEITYDRLALLTDGGSVLQACEPQSLDLGVEFKRTKEELPESEQLVIDYEDPGELPYVQADPGQISFMFSTILSYLTRLSGGEEKSVNVSIVNTGQTLDVRFSARIPLPSDAAENARPLWRARFDLALGEPTIRAFADKNHAVYKMHSNAAGTIIDLGFPVPMR
jgi:PAS domain S-box-containing protein